MRQIPAYLFFEVYGNIRIDSIFFEDSLADKNIHAEIVLRLGMEIITQQNNFDNLTR
jgi:hypothetical protein